jgi:hypothetical protein
MSSFQTFGSGFLSGKGGCQPVGMGYAFASPLVRLHHGVNRTGRAVGQEAEPRCGVLPEAPCPQILAALGKLARPQSVMLSEGCIAGLSSMPWALPRNSMLLSRSDRQFPRRRGCRTGAGTTGAGNTLSPEERATAWRESVKGLPDTKPLSDEAASRESNYSARG